MKLELRRILLALFLAIVAAGATGCASTDPENASARPWNAPKTWETGVPSIMTEGR